MNGLSQATAIKLVLLIEGLAIAIASAEYLAAREILADHGLLSWRVGKFSHRWASSGRHGIVAAPFDYQTFCAVLVARLLAGIAMCVIAIVGYPTPLPSLIAFTATFMIGVRNGLFGTDGAHQMNLVLLAAVTVAVAAGQHGPTALVALGFVALQCSLCYLVAGTSKLVSPIWRSGAALQGIMSTQIYGHDALFKLLTKSRALARGGCWTTIAVEMAFTPLCLISTPTALLAICAMGGLHVTIALTMGLNGFLLSFLAAYPAVWLVFGLIRHAW